MNYIEVLTKEIESYDRYNDEQVKFIENGKDYTSKEKLSYIEWLEKWKEHSHVKVEGIDYHKLNLNISDIADKEIKNTHLFVCNKNGKSFKPHSDKLNVFLYVIKGKKEIFFYDESKEVVDSEIVEEGKGIFIYAGEIHSVKSDNHTWALSIGCK